MTNEDKIRDEKVQYYIKRETAKISALSSGKINKYEFLTGEEILPSDQSRIIEQGKFTHSLLSKAFEKQIKTIADQRIKQVEALKTLKAHENKQDIEPINELFLKEMRNDEIKNEIDEIK